MHAYIHWNYCYPVLKYDHPPWCASGFARILATTFSQELVFCFKNCLVLVWEKMALKFLDRSCTNLSSFNIRMRNEGLENQSEPSNSILHCFCLTRGSLLTSQWFVYQNWLEPSGGICHLYKRNRLLWFRFNCQLTLFSFQQVPINNN